MSDWELPWEGGCRCGQVRFRVTRAPLLTSVCHCTGCQRMTGSAFSLSIAIPSDGFELTLGKPVRGGVQAENDHRHCPFCKSWLFTRPQAIDFVNVRAPMMDNSEWIVPYVETWAGEKLDWVQTPALHRFESLPELSAWPEILAEFSREYRPRPRPSNDSSS
ncbi:MAG: GFA family protein [Candidatus Eremiobacteraeota bacterium]|nr:GFA family protein [Candidatus Eremiobacteraeota bacterium]